MPFKYLPRAPVTVARLNKQGIEPRLARVAQEEKQPAIPQRDGVIAHTRMASEIPLLLRTPSSGFTIFCKPVLGESLCHLTIRFRFPVAGWGWRGVVHPGTLRESRMDAWARSWRSPRILGSCLAPTRVGEKAEKVNEDRESNDSKSVGSIACLESPKEVAVVRICFPQSADPSRHEMRDASAG